MNTRVSRFVAVGIFNTIVDFTILNTLVFIFDLGKLPANIISTLTAMSISYLLNHGFVFKDEHSRSGKQFALFLSITAFGLLVIQNIVIYIFVHFITWPADVIHAILDTTLPNSFSQEFVRLNVAKVIATLITMVWNYELYKRFVFKKVKNNETEP